jgi:uracil-DNA glycosylase
MNFSNIHNSWISFFKKNESLLQSIEKKINEVSVTSIYPPISQRYRVFEKDISQIKIVLIGQDPYHGKNQANGLSFSVSNNMKIPPSLVNIYKEIQNNFPERNYEFHHGDISRWFYEEHIFLLNASLSVEEGKAGSHLKYWESFTNDVIKYISQNNKDAIFLLFGNYAISKEKFIENKEQILSTSHPSPLGAYKGFIGSKIFKKCEEKIGHQINWFI